MKTTYDEALEILLDSFKDPQDEDNDCFMFNFRQIVKIEKALLQAQKHEEVVKKVIVSISRAELSKFQIMSILSASIGVGNEYDDINLREFEKDE